MAETQRPVKYRVVGIRKDGRQVPLCSYMSLEAVERIALLAQTDAAFKRILIESDDEIVRRAQI